MTRVQRDDLPVSTLKEETTVRRKSFCVESDFVVVYILPQTNVCMLYAGSTSLVGRVHVVVGRSVPFVILTLCCDLPRHF